jgi:putative flippase GtrA
MAGFSRPYELIRHFFQSVAGGQSEKIRYLLVGGVNTCFGYFSSLLMYWIFKGELHLVFISLLSNVIGITFSFVLYKLLVFKTEGSWVKEYARSYVTYGVSIILGVCMIWLMVDFGGVRFWIAQAFVMCITISISYVMHKRYTFIRRR